MHQMVEAQLGTELLLVLVVGLTMLGCLWFSHKFKCGGTAASRRHKLASSAAPTPSAALQQDQAEMLMIRTC